MKQLTCEMCGSTNLLKEDGVFVCQECGTKYSVEEAKKMMAGGDDSAPAAATKSTGGSTVVENYVEMAKNAESAGNNQEAELYANKALELDPTHYYAWLIKGNAAGWQSKVASPRFNESVDCWKKAVNNCPKNNESLRQALCNVIAVNAKGLATSLMSSLTSTFVKYPSANSDTDISAGLRHVSSFISATESISSDINLDTVNIWKDITDNINSSCIQANNAVRNAYGITMDDRNKYAYATYKEKTLAIINIYYLTLPYCTTIGILNTMYSNLKITVKTFVDTPYYEYKVGSAGSYHSQVDCSYTDKSTAENRVTSAANVRPSYAKKILDNPLLEDIYYLEEAVECLKGTNISNLTALDYISVYYGRVKEVSAAARLINAVIILNEKNHFSESNALAHIAKAMEQGAEIAGSDKEKELCAKVIDYVEKTLKEDHSVSLLQVAAAHYDYNKVEYLVNNGASVDVKNHYEVTALWYVCYKSVEEDKRENAVKIAKLLLDKGASVDVTNKGGIALFNAQTDVEIAKLIQEKHPEAQRGAAPKKSGCYVATAVYGSYNCPEVWTLRRYRDETLACTWYGRVFIRTYYAISPTLVKWFGKTEWFRNMWKGRLDAMVERLQNEGVENTPYEDKNW